MIDFLLRFFYFTFLLGHYIAAYEVIIKDKLPKIGGIIFIVSIIGCLIISIYS